MEKITSNAKFSEAHFSMGSPTPGAQAIHIAGASKEVSSGKKEESLGELRVKKL